MKTVPKLLVSLGLVFTLVACSNSADQYIGQDDYKPTTAIGKDQNMPLGGGYYRQGDSVFLNDVHLGLDVDSFEHLGGAYVRDSKNLYVYYSKRDVADLSTLVYLRDGYAFDSKNVYYYKPCIHGYDNYCGGILDGADLLTFEILGNNYSRDASTVYYHTSPVKNADMSSFEFLGDSYAKDSKSIFTYGVRILGADFASFRFIADKAEDRLSEYSSFLNDGPAVLNGKHLVVMQVSRGAQKALTVNLEIRDRTEEGGIYLDEHTNLWFLPRSKNALHYQLTKNGGKSGICINGGLLIYRNPKLSPEKKQVLLEAHCDDEPVELHTIDLQERIDVG